MSKVVYAADAERRKAYIAGLCHPYLKDASNPYPKATEPELWERYEAGRNWTLENGNKSEFIS